MYEKIHTKQFKKDAKLMKKQGKNGQKLQDVLNKLVMGIPLPIQNRDHALSNNWDNARECHIEPDWLLIYEIDNKNNTLTLLRTGSHSELFETVSVVQKLNQSLDEVLLDTVDAQKSKCACRVNLDNLCKRSNLGTKVREMLQPENLIGLFATTEELFEYLDSDED